MISNNEKMEVKTKTSSSGEVNSRPKGAMANAGWNTFFTLISGMVGFFLTPLMIHYLGVQQFGILLLIWSITGILTLADIGVEEATLRYVAYHYGDGNIPGINRVIGCTLSFYAVICVVISVVLLIATPTIVAFLKIPAVDRLLVCLLLRLTALVFSLALISGIFAAIQKALLRYDISSKIAIGQNVARAIGYILLVISNYGILQLVIWDVVLYFITIIVQVAVMRKLAPGIRILPSFSFRGLREIIGYSLYAFLTYFFIKVFRESGKIILVRYVGPSSVAYLGTPESVTARFHSLVLSSSETMLPRFSANRDPKVARELFLRGTWAALVLSIICFIPIVVLMPDFLSLWITPEFSMESAAVGQLLALSYITQGAFAPAATFFRGKGMPWVVSIVFVLAGIGTLILCVILVPTYGVLGVGYALLICSIAHFLGLLSGWFYLFGKSSMANLLRSVGLPLLMAGIAFTLESVIRARFTEVNWFGLFALGGLFAGITALLVLCADWVLGGDSLSKHFLKRIGESDKARQWLSYISARKIR